MSNGRAWRRWRTAWPFVVLCLFSGSRWLIEGGFPASSSTLVSQAAGCLMAAMVLIPARRFTGSAMGWHLVGKTRSWTAAIAAALVLTGPALAGSIAGEYLNANNTTLAMALVPAVVAVAASVGGEADHGDVTGLLWPGLAGVAGLLLLVPQPSFGDLRPWLGMVAMPLIVGVGAGVWSTQTRQSRERMHVQGRVMEILSLIMAAVTFTLLAVLHHVEGGELAFTLSATALDGLTAALTLLVLQRFGAIRWSAQFLLIPLIALLEGVVLLRPLLDGRSYLAFGLMGVGALYQWKSRPTNARERHPGEPAAGVPGA